MKISWKWINELVDLSGHIKTPTELAKLLTDRGLEVEELELQNKGLDKVVSAHVVEKLKHPNSDRLSLCKIDAGDGKIIEVVCGATNHKTGDKVILAQVGAELPNGMKIGQGKIRDVISNGMLCSEAELGISKESDGIIILDPSVKPGLQAAQVLNREDAVLTLKLYANQSHCLSHVGVAREIAAHLAYLSGKKPESFLKVLKYSDLKEAFIPFKVDLQTREAPRFIAAFIKGVKVTPSPKWLVQRLETLAQRSINNVVDATNLILLETGHPVHAYDASKVKGGVIGVRIAKPNEKIPLLDQTEVNCEGFELVIKDGSDQAIGLAGVMGGGNSEVSETTVDLLLECAEFNPSLIRKTKVKHQKLTEAASRFEKGIDSASLFKVMSRLVQLITELAGGACEGVQTQGLIKESFRASVSFPKLFIQNYLGMNLSDGKLTQVFDSLSCPWTLKDEKYDLKIPSYRLDLNIKEDLSEEVARTVGYDQIPSTLPTLSSEPKSLTQTPASARARLVHQMKDLMKTQGLCEALNYGFTSSTWLKSFGMSSSLKLLNPLSEEWEWMVPSLIPGLVQNVLHNQRHHFGSEKLSVRLFECRPTFINSRSTVEMINEMDTGVEEKWKLSFALSGREFAQALKVEENEVEFSQLKALLERFFLEMGTKGVRWISLDQSRNKETVLAKVFHPGKSVEILVGNQSLGFAGLFHPKLSQSMKLKNELYLAEFDVDTLLAMSREAHQAPKYKKWSEFPPMERDFAFVIDQSVTSDQVVNAVIKAAKPLAKSARVFDRYIGPQVAQGRMSLALKVTLQDETRVLTEAEAEGAQKAIIASLQKELGAELR